MKIYIEDEMLEFDNNKDEIDNILTTIDGIIEKSHKILNLMKIDDVEIYNDYHNYLLDNIRYIEKIEVSILTYKQLIDNILISTLDYLQKVPILIEELSDEFYKTPDGKSWNNLKDFLNALAWIMDTFSSIDNDKRLKDIVENYEEWNLYAKEIFFLKAILPDLEEALLNEDNISIGDILSYEIVPIFNKMKQRLLELLNVEGALNDTSR